MLLNRLKIAAAVLVLVGALGVGGAGLARRTEAAPPPTVRGTAPDPEAADPADPRARPAGDAPQSLEELRRRLRELELQIQERERLQKEADALRSRVRELEQKEQTPANSVRIPAAILLDADPDKGTVTVIFVGSVDEAMTEGLKIGDYEDGEKATLTVGKDAVFHISRHDKPSVGIGVQRTLADLKAAAGNPATLTLAAEGDRIVVKEVVVDWRAGPMPPRKGGR
jgi:hypothetical protein